MDDFVSRVAEVLDGGLAVASKIELGSDIRFVTVAIATAGRAGVGGCESGSIGGWTRDPSGRSRTRKGTKFGRVPCEQNERKSRVTTLACSPFHQRQRFSTVSGLKAAAGNKGRSAAAARSRLLIEAGTPPLV
jgi:hypothetical protein